MSIEFPLLEKRTHLGVIPDPKIDILILEKSGYAPYRFLLDTGADCTMMPSSAAEDLDIDLNRCPIDRSYGIEGNGVKVYISQITAKIGDYELTIKCLFSEKETTPYLLGRIDIFSHFNITFDNEQKKIILTPILIDHVNPAFEVGLNTVRNDLESMIIITPLRG
ncbi:MAG: aspartyl protease family protein [Nitrospirota bacterium]